VDMAYDILKKARGPLHVSVLLERIESAFGVAVDRESLVSSLSKKIARRDRFLRTEKNTFGLLPGSK
jgi:HB1, ASXL, restriction endonuclease HTH domain